MSLKVQLMTLYICRLLDERVNRLKTMLAAVQHGQILSANDQTLLDSVNEDTHWLLLITGLSFCLDLFAHDRTISV